MAALLYKQNGAGRTVFCLLFAAVLAGFSTLAAAETNPVYTIEGVEVDVTAENAVKAREKALGEAQLKAYQMLAERLLGPEELKTFRLPDADSVSMLVQDFEVTNEQLSRVRYKGTYTIRFRPNAMRSQIASQGRSYSDQVQKPIMVLPFYKKGDTATMLWSEMNPWMAAWRTLPADRSALQPTVLPLGDASDIGSIDEGDITDYDPMRMQEMANRYGADDAAILLAVESLGVPRRMSVNIYKHGFEGPVFVRKIDIVQQEGEADAAFYSRAAQQMKGFLRQGWKNDAAFAGGVPQTTTQIAVAQPGGAPPLPYTRQAAGPATTFNIHARFASVQEWVKLKAALDRTSGVQSVLVKTLRPREAMLDIRYAGTIVQFQAALQSSGIMMRSSGAGRPVELYMPAVFTNPYRN